MKNKADIQLDWWWNKTRFKLPPQHPQYPNENTLRDWADGMEQTAFEFELVRRLNPKKKLPRFCDLDGFTQENLKARLHPPRLRPSLKKTTANSLPDFTAPDPTTGGFRWNLKNTDAAIGRTYASLFLPKERHFDLVFHGVITPMEMVAAINAKKAKRVSKAKFLQTIHAEQMRQNITPPKKLSGLRNRSVSWRWLEVLDVAQNKLNSRFSASETERQTKKKAIALAKKISLRYLKTIAEIEKIKRHFKIKMPPYPLLAVEI